MDEALGITMGSSIQIALFLTPFLVIIGFFMDKPMSLSTPYSSCHLRVDFRMYPAAIIFLSVTLTEFLIMDGKSTWMKGVLLLSVYTIIAMTYWGSS